VLFGAFQNHNLGPQLHPAMTGSLGLLCILGHSVQEQRDLAQFAGCAPNHGIEGLDLLCFEPERRRPVAQALRNIIAHREIGDAGLGEEVSRRLRARLGIETGTMCPTRPPFGANQIVVPHHGFYCAAKQASGCGGCWEACEVATPCRARCHSARPVQKQCWVGIQHGSLLSRGQWYNLYHTSMLLAS